ncbi:hypothetical protein BJ912DRAFT_1079961 [Pholiota molesta]|nr:hypothetical protein BJ912DRAFT_1079961 [Pholiota molesta]
MRRATPEHEPWGAYTPELTSTIHTREGSLALEDARHTRNRPRGVKNDVVQNFGQEQRTGIKEPLASLQALGSANCIYRRPHQATARPYTRFDDVRVDIGRSTTYTKLRDIRERVLRRAETLIIALESRRSHRPCRDSQQKAAWVKGKESERDEVRGMSAVEQSMRRGTIIKDWLAAAFASTPRLASSTKYCYVLHDIPVEFPPFLGYILRRIVHTNTTRHGRPAVKPIRIRTAHRTPIVNGDHAHFVKARISLRAPNSTSASVKPHTDSQQPLDTSSPIAQHAAHMLGLRQRQTNTAAQLRCGTNSADSSAACGVGRDHIGTQKKAYEVGVM